MKNKIPKLRFKEFSDEWEEKKLGEIGKISSGLTPLRSEKKYFENGHIPWIKTTDLNNGYISRSEELITSYALEKTTLKLLPINTILIAMYGGFNQIGRTGLTKIETTINQAISGIILKKSCSSEYVLQYLNGFKENWKFVAASSRKDPNITKKDVENFKVTIPSLQEQEKIANFLSSVDIKIEMLEKKKELLSDYKKGMMQNLFSQKLRFKDEDGNHYPEWRKGLIKEFGSFYYGKSAPKSTITLEGITPCVRYGELYSTYNEVIKEIKSYTTMEAKDLKISKGGELLVPRVGEKPLEFSKCSYLPFEGIAIGEMISVYENKENGIYLSYYFNSQLTKEFARLVEGGNVSNLYFRYLENVEINLPSLPEQEKIANFLSSIDRKIELVVVELEKNKEFKKGLLQQMFV